MAIEGNIGGRIIMEILARMAGLFRPWGMIVVMKVVSRMVRREITVQRGMVRAFLAFNIVNIYMLKMRFLCKKLTNFYKSI